VWVVPVVFGCSLECLLCVGLPSHDLVTLRIREKSALRISCLSVRLATAPL
jgi:hypothetical protein